jgi:hypothetical protein
MVQESADNPAHLHVYANWVALIRVSQIPADPLDEVTEESLHGPNSWDGMEKLCEGPDIDTRAVADGRAR